MKLLKQCVIDFFALAVGECGTKKELSVRYLREAVLEFLDNPDKHSADNIYNSFFDAFRMRTDNLAFFDILDALHTYEKQTAGLTDSQRDHFLHSVWVFLLGLGVFAENERYRSSFKNSSYVFLYRWGLTSLLHDIGYPVEITFNQFKQYVECMIDIDNDENSPEPYFEYGKMDELLYIHNNLEKSFISYLAQNIAQALGTDPVKTEEELQSYPNIKGTSGYIDHGFYSAIMMLRWNGMLMEKSNISTFTFESDIVDAATAILLHNYYKRPLQKTYALPPLTAHRHPLAFMIILCDELQEWDRTAYGKKNKNKPLSTECEILLSENQIAVNYSISVVEGSDKKETAEKYSQNKIKTLMGLLSLKDVFCELDPDFITTVVTGERQKDIAPVTKAVSARPLLEELETVAKVIHENYCKKYPDSVIGRLKWEVCDYHFRYDNISQARHLFSFIADNGYIALEKGNTLGLEEVSCIDPRVVERFAEEEHKRWMRSKITDGWQYSSKRDDNKKLHPMLIPYSELAETEKNKDRAPLIEFADTLRSINKVLYKKRTEHSGNY